MPSATSLVARSYPDRIIGIENALPWHLGTDMKHFRERTRGNAVIMGRKTYESIGKPLPKRLNIVLSRTPIKENDGVRWAPNPETALLLADQYSIYNMRKEFFVIGGEEIYNIFDKYINVVYLTDVNTGNINGDAKFDREFISSEWYFRFEREFPKTDVDDYSFRISCIVRRKPFHRFASRQDFLSKGVDVLGAWERYTEMTKRSDPDDLVEGHQLDFLEQL
ncbi:MAG: dihydrofolate reductase [Pseudomonadales bacterium]